jgi:hypothetical protein
LTSWGLENASGSAPPRSSSFLETAKIKMNQSRAHSPITSFFFSDLDIYLFILFNHFPVILPLTGIHRVFHPMVANYTFFSAAHRTFSKIEHFNKYKKIEVIPYILTDHNGIKLQINSKKTTKTIQTHGD